jgi:hypothetical protein
VPIVFTGTTASYRSITAQEVMRAKKKFLIRWRRDDQRYMNRDPGTPTAVGGFLTDRTITPALPMPYTGGRADFASRASFPDEGRGAYAK